MPSILFINQHYAPDVAATGQMLTDLAEYLIDDGVDVTVLCGHTHYGQGRVGAPRFETRNGVRVYRASMSAFGRGHTLGRLADYGTFYLHVLRSLLLKNHYDLVVVLTTPPLMHVAGALARWLHGTRYAIWSMDLHPDAEEASGMISTNGIRARVLHRLNDMGHRNAEFVVALGPYMRQRILAKGVDSGRCHAIPVWTNADDVGPIDKRNNPLARQLGLDDRFVIMYSGNAGLAHRFDEVKHTMCRLRHCDRLVFLFVGAGPRRKEIEAFIQEHDIRNARYLDYFERDQLRLSIPMGDLHLVTLQNEFAGIAAPSKVYGIMAAGRPILFLGPPESEPAHTIRETQAGVVVATTEKGEASQKSTFELTLLALIADRERREALGRNGRKAFEAQFNRDVACAMWSRVVKDTIAPDSSTE